MTDPELLRRIDRLQATLQLAYSEPLGRARDRIRSDTVSAAILDATEDWQPAGELQAKIAKLCSVSARTVRDRLAALTTQGVLEADGETRNRRYRSTGLV